MARPQKNNADYFPHDNNMWSDRRIVALRNKFGLTGYAVWNLLLETLCESENFETDYNDTEFGLLANFWGVDVKKLKEIFDFLETLKLIQIDNGKLWSDKFKKRLKPVLDERERKRKWSRKRWQKDDSSEESDVDNEVLDVANPSSSEESTASSIIKERKENKSKRNKSKEKKKKENTNTQKRIFGDSCFEYQISKIFLNLNLDKAPIKYLKEQNGEEELLQEWADEVRKMKEIDQYTEKQIEFIFEYTAQHDFWKDQIMSVKKFRQKNKAGVPYFVVIIDETRKQAQNSPIADFSD